MSGYEQTGLVPGPALRTAVMPDPVSQIKRYIKEAFASVADGGKYPLSKFNTFVVHCLNDSKVAARALEMLDCISSDHSPFYRARRIARIASRLSRDEGQDLLNWYMSHVAVEYARRNCAFSILSVPAGSY